MAYEFFAEELRADRGSFRRKNRFAGVESAAANAVRTGRFAAIRAGFQGRYIQFVSTCKTAHVATALGTFLLRDCHILSFWYPALSGGGAFAGGFAAFCLALKLFFLTTFYNFKFFNTANGVCFTIFAQAQRPAFRSVPH